LRGSSPYEDDWFKRPNMDDRITTKLEIAKYLWARSGSLRAHATQVDEKEPFWFGLSDEELADVYPFEDWILAKSSLENHTADSQHLEDDLFAGIR